MAVSTEKTYRTYAAWRRAILARWPNATFDGDADICSAFCRTIGIGEWDGAIGVIYS